MVGDDSKLPFWFDDGLPTSGASENELALLESMIGERLPPALRDLLAVRNGGVSNFAAFVVGETRVPLPALFSVMEISASVANSESFGTPDGVVAFGGDGDDWVGLDYRQGRVPEVVYQEHDDAPLEVVASSVDELLAGLVEE